MKKLKSFAIAAGLLLVTAGVFAGKAKFFTTLELYSFNTVSSSYNQLISSSATWVDLTTSSSEGPQASINPSGGGAAQPLYGYSTTGGMVKAFTTF